jgi:hypothetical protein
MIFNLYKLSMFQIVIIHNAFTDYLHSSLQQFEVLVNMYDITHIYMCIYICFI